MRRVSGNGGAPPRARVLAFTVPVQTGAVCTVPSFGLLAPVTFAKTGGNANLTINAATGAISATAAIAAGASQILTGKVTGADGCVIPFVATLTGAVAALAALTLSAGAATIGAAITLNLLGATAGSVITGVMPDGLTLNSAARTISGTPRVAGVYGVVLTETLPGAPNSPRVTVVALAVSFPATNYVVNNAAELATVLANSDATLSGKVIVLNPGNYGAVTLTGRTFAPALIIRGANPAVQVTGNSGELVRTNTATHAIINKLTWSGSTGVNFYNLDITSSDWHPNPAPCVRLAGIHTHPGFYGCLFRAGYRGNVDVPFNVIDHLPEYACITATVVGGAVTALDHTARPYVGDLVADGTWPLTFLGTGGTGFSATMTVAGGYITGTNLISGGTGYTNVPSAPTARISWAAQTPMTWLPYGIQDQDGATRNMGDLPIQGCLFEDLSNAIKGGVPFSTGAFAIERNSFRRIYMDYMSFGTNSAQTTAPGGRICDNYGTQCFSLNGDSFDPHADFLQFFMNAAQTIDWTGLLIERNVFNQGNARGGVQGFFVADPNAGIAYSARIMGNLVASAHLGNGLLLERTKNSYVRANTVVYWDPADLFNSGAINLVANDALSYNAYWDNIAEGFSQGGSASSRVNRTRANRLLGFRGATLSYASTFVGAAAGTERPTTKDAALAWFAPTPAAAGKGAIQPGYIDHVARTIDVSQEPSFIQWTALAAQVASSNVSSEWSQLLGGPDVQTIAVAGGTYQIADDAAGTNASVATAVAGNVARGKFIRLNLANGAGSSQTTTATATINGQDFTFSSTTVSTAAWNYVRFDGADRFVRAAGAMGADSPYATILFRAKFPAANPGASVFLFGCATGVGFVAAQMQTTGLLRVLAYNAAGTLIGRTDMTGASLCTGGEHEICIGLDQAQENPLDGKVIVVDGVDRTSAATTTWVPGNIGWSRTGVQMAIGGTTTLMISGYDVAVVGIKVGVRDDVKNPVVRAGYAPDTLVPGDWTVLAKGNAAAWNAGAGINLGTGAKYVAAAGSAVVDA